MISSGEPGVTASVDGDRAALRCGDWATLREAAVPVRTEVTSMPLTAANAALARLRDGEISGAVVLSCRMAEMA